MSITDETRKLSYENVTNNLTVRQLGVLQALEEVGSVTANELAHFVFQKGLTTTTDRNNVHPRLNELVEMQLVDVIGKRECSISKRTCAIYQKAMTLV